MKAFHSGVYLAQRRLQVASYSKATIAIDPLRMQSLTPLQLPANSLCRTRHKTGEGVSTYFPAANVSCTTRYETGRQLQVCCQYKPSWHVELCPTLYYSQTQRRTTAAATGAHSCPDEAWSKTLVVVEGLSDQRAVRKAVPAQVRYSFHAPSPLPAPTGIHHSAF